MTFDIEDFDDETGHRRERKFAAFYILLLAVVGFYAIYDDWKQQVSLTHLVVESLLHLVTLSVGTYLLIALFRSKRQSLRKFRTEHSEISNRADEFHRQIAQFKDGVTEAITKQLAVWRLTPGESEIALFLLKGLSLQEIAELRQTSERTVRQQASVIYKKSELSGRSQLSAFFLEDMLS